MFEREQTTILAGRIEIDDAYLGGERTGGTVGRGAENKIPFVAAVETNDQGHPKRAVFPLSLSGLLWEAGSRWPSTLISALACHRKACNQSVC